MKISKLGALVGAIVMSAVPGFAQQGDTHISQDGRPDRLFRPVSGLNTDDIEFMKNADIANIFEVQTSELAATRSTDPFVLEFAKEMIADHNGSLEELKAVAGQKSVSLPQDLPGPMKRMYERLQHLNGAEFDAAYEHAQKSGHEDASRLFKAEIRNGRDQDVKAYAVKTLPIVTMHYKMILTKQTMMGPNKMTGGG